MEVVFDLLLGEGVVSMWDGEVFIVKADNQCL